MQSASLFRVGGHYFSVCAPDEFCWAEMENLSPFRVNEMQGAGQPLFTLDIVDTLPFGKKVPLWVGKTEPGMQVTDLYEFISKDFGSGYAVAFALCAGEPHCAWMVMDSSFTHAKLRIGSQPRFSLDNALMLLYAFSSAKFNTLEIHASVVKKDGGAAIFIGESGAGKSTHSSLWCSHLKGTELINDDNPILRIENGVVYVYGSPWSGKTPCYKDISAPVKGVVKIVQAKENRMFRQPLLQSYALLSSSSSGFRPIGSMADSLHSTIAFIAESIPFYILECLPDSAAAELSYKTLYGTAG